MPGRPVAQSADEFALEGRGLVRRFGHTTALAGVSLSVRKGEFFSLLGPSGCGKTTLLRIVAGLELPDSGDLSISGRNASDLPANERPVHTVFQSYALFPHLSVWDNVAFGLRMRKVPATELADRVRHIMDVVQITRLKDRRPAQLSGGEKQRVALARAIVNEPEVLLLDEPLGALDLKLRKQLQLELHQLQRRLGITFIYVTHDQDEAIVMSDRIAVMNAGQIEQVDTPRALYERPRTRFVAQFLGLCNLLHGTVGSVAGRLITVLTAAGTFRVRLPEGSTAPPPGSTATLAVRPENVRFCSPDSQDAPNCFQTLVKDILYGGAESHYRLEANGCELTAVTLNAGAGQRPLNNCERACCAVAEDSFILLEHQ